VILLAFAAALAGPPAGPPQPDLSDDRVRLATQLDVLEALVDNGMPEQAMAMVAEMHKQGADDPRIDVAQGRAMHQRGLDHDAERALEAAVKRAPRSADAWSALGVLQADLGKLGAAESSLARAVKFDPKNPDIQNNYGFVLLAVGRPELAIPAFQAALAADPSSTRARNNLGFAYVRLDRYDEALEMFRAAASEPDARYNFGVACEQNGDRAAALTSYQAAVTAQPGHALAVAALSRLLKEGSP